MNNYQELIEQGHKIIKESREDAFKEFLNEIHFQDNFVYDVRNKNSNLIFTIYTKQPGIWIGYKGKNVKILEEILTKVENQRVFVEFKEIRGEFLNI